MEKILDNIKPFNRFFFRSCFFHQLIPVYTGFGIEAYKAVINYIGAYRFNKKTKTLSLKDKQIFTRYQFWRLTGIEEIRVKGICGDITENLILTINKESPAVVAVDCFYLPYNESASLKYHAEHYILVYGYISDTREFVVMDNISPDDFRQIERRIPYADLEKAYTAALKILKPSHDAFVKFRKTHYTDRDFYQKILRGFQKRSGIIKKSLCDLSGAITYYKKTFLSKACDKNFLKKFKADFWDLKWRKFRQAHHFMYTAKRFAETPAYKKITEAFNEVVSSITKLYEICDAAVDTDLIIKELDNIEKNEFFIAGYLINPE